MRELSSGTYLGEVTRSVRGGDTVVTVARYAGMRGDHSDWHRHANLHMGLILSGSGRSECRDRDGGGWPEGMFVYRAGQEHAWIPDRGGSVAVNIELGEGFLRALGATEDAAVAALRNNGRARVSMLEIFAQARRPTRASVGRIRGLLLDLVIEAADVGSPPPGWADVVREQLLDRWNERISLDELSRVAGVHPVTVSRGFRRHFGETLSGFVRRLRVERSLPLIRDSRLTLAEVAQRCGFADQSHFTRSFRQVTGLAPGALRDTARRG